MCQALRRAAPLPTCWYRAPQGLIRFARPSVVTAAVKKMVGSQRLPLTRTHRELRLGGRADFHPVIFPQGRRVRHRCRRSRTGRRPGLVAAAGPITASAVARELQGGQVSPGSLLTLAELASQWRSPFLAFGDRAPVQPGIHSVRLTWFPVAPITPVPGAADV
jgi:hypothetical protein